MKTALFATILTMAAFVSHSSLAQEISPDVRKVGQARLTLAEQLIGALDSNLVCDTDAYPSEINQLISSASMQLDQAVIENWASLAVPATSVMHADFAFRQAVHPFYLGRLKYSAADLADLTKQLEGTLFHAFGVGVYGSQSKAALGKSGVATMKVLEQLEAAPWTVWKSRKSTWELVVPKAGSGNDIQIKIDGTVYNIEPKSGEYWLVPTNVPADEVQGKTLTSTDSYCEA